MSGRWLALATLLSTVSALGILVVTGKIRAPDRGEIPPPGPPAVNVARNDRSVVAVLEPAAAAPAVAEPARTARPSTRPRTKATADQTPPFQKNAARFMRELNADVPVRAPIKVAHTSRAANAAIDRVAAGPVPTSTPTSTPAAEVDELAALATEKPAGAAAARTGGVAASADNARIDALVDKAFVAPQPETEAAPTEAALPALGRDEILATLKDLGPAIRARCQFGERGLALVRIEVDRTGMVQNAAVEGRFAGKPAGYCVEAMVKEARFPASAGTSFRYPFKLR